MKNNYHTIEYGVGDQPTRVHDLVADSRNRLAIPILDIIERAVVAPQLLRVIALNVTTVVLEKVGKLVIEQYRGRDVERNIELNEALGRGGVAGRIYKRILGRRELGTGLRRTKAVAIIWHLDEIVLSSFLICRCS